MDSKGGICESTGEWLSAMPFKSFAIQFKPTATKDLHYSESLIYEIIFNASDDPNKFEDKRRLVLLEMAGSHYAVICLEEDETGIRCRNCSISYAVETVGNYSIHHRRVHVWNWCS